MKKILIIFLIIFCFGCTSDKIKTISKGNGSSKTYLFFKNFDSTKYYVKFYDRNSSINDDTKIIMARDGEKYYYEIDGEVRNSILQMDGYKYSLDYNNLVYYKQPSPLEDFSYGILPTDIDKLKTDGYTTGRAKVFNSKYIFENYVNGKDETTYYFRGNKLIYVKYKSIQHEILLKFDSMNKKPDSKLFELGDLTEITY